MQPCHGCDPGSNPGADVADDGGWGKLTMTGDIYCEDCGKKFRGGDVVWSISKGVVYRPRHASTGLNSKEDRGRICGDCLNEFLKRNRTTCQDT